MILTIQNLIQPNSIIQNIKLLIDTTIHPWHKGGMEKKSVGRPRQYHEKRVQARIPVRLVEEFKEWLRLRLDKEVVKD